VKKYIVRLAKAERGHLKELISTGKHSSHKLTRARILLKADQGKKKEWLTDKEIAKAIDVSIPTVERVRKRFVLEGFDAALNHREPKSRPHKIDGDIEARLVSVVCGKAPGGRQRWTLELLADELVRLKFFESISPETVRQALKKTSLSLGREKNG
jgi:transposase